ncbi:MAG: YlxR family protein [Deltaproteobacteria bacterium]|nr:YlxR family protein [Deltaproteobacteria bacterium]MBW1924235.1 YlxR family protein [Deltaproteobacteria bacterium]MBW1949208.1 YlxR family protein [Deltaproteobacteria bacterium]MBW2007183.1 YlxR family protein [Deltaproteobacteria bacterium]MBW2102899.1 YlxR family protein [Deltaproteobacteria bacterium]
MVCRAKRPKAQLLRLVVDEASTVVSDSRGNRGGRGAYVCREGACLSHLSGVKNLHRAFRRSHPVKLSPDLQGL